MNRLFDDFRTGFDGLSFGATWPKVEVAETDKQYSVTAELPGLEENDVQVKLADDALVISGEKRAETDDRDRRVSERFYGRFERTIPFAVDVDPENVSASFKNGVLTVKVAKAPGAEARYKAIPINKAG